LFLTNFKYLQSMFHKTGGCIKFRSILLLFTVTKQNITDQRTQSHILMLPITTWIVFLMNIYNSSPKSLIITILDSFCRGATNYFSLLSHTKHFINQKMSKILSLVFFHNYKLTKLHCSAQSCVQFYQT
jgi:hypothetical protein